MRASWQSHRSSSLVFAVPRCVHTEPFARLDGPVAPVGRLVFGQDAVLLHDAVGQASCRAAPRHMRPDSYEVGHQRGTAKRDPSPMASSRTRPAAFTATGSPASRSL